MIVKNPQKVTIRTIAKHLGLSHQTVSNVLSGQAKKRKVSDVTALKVKKAADKLGYMPNHWARSLQSSKTGVVSVLFNGLHLDWAERIMNSIEGALEKSGYLATIAIYGRLPMYANVSRKTEERKIESILQRRDEGVICQPSPYTKKGYELLQKWQLPTVFIGSVLDDMSGLEKVSSVTWDCGPAVKTAVRHLVKTGRRRIAFVGGRHGVQSDAVRFSAFQEAMNEAGLPVKPEWIMWDPLKGPITENLLKPMFVYKDECPDAIFAINDSFAAFIVEFLISLGMKSPDDVAIVGMGDLRITHAYGITTMKEPLEEIGRGAAEVMLEILENSNKAPIHRKIDCNELVVRRTA